MNRSKNLFRWRGILAGFVLWTLYGALSAWISHYQRSFSKRPLSWGDALFYEGSWAYILGILSIGVIWAAERFRLERPKVLRNLFILLLCNSCYAASATGLIMLLELASGYYTNPVTLSSYFMAFNYELQDTVPLFWVVVFLHYAVDYYRRYQRGLVEASDLNAQLAHAQLQALKMQLHPHFLFNTLHAISELIHEDPHAAEQMVIGLSQLLRLSLDTSSMVETPLQQELRFIQLYLDIEKMRFDDRLQISMDIDPEVRDAMVPSLILQPLLENAIKHGISKRPGQGQVSVCAHKDNDFLVISVRDNGAGYEMNHDSGLPQREGIGLSTTRARLQKLYGSKQSFHFVKRAETGAEASIRLPLRIESTGKAIHELTSSADR